MIGAGPQRQSSPRRRRGPERISRNVWQLRHSAQPGARSGEHSFSGRISSSPLSFCLNGHASLRSDLLRLVAGSAGQL